MLSLIEYHKSATMKPVKHSFDLMLIDSAATEPVHLLFSPHLWSVKNSLFTSVGSLEMLRESIEMVCIVFAYSFCLQRPHSLAWDRWVNEELQCSKMKRNNGYKYGGWDKEGLGGVDAQWNLENNEISSILI